MSQTGQNKLNPATMFFDSSPFFTIQTGAVEKATQLEDFRWETHIPLPFPFPQKSVIHEQFTVDTRTYRAHIGGACNRVFATLQPTPEGPKFPEVRLEFANHPPTKAHNELHAIREPLQAVAIFHERNRSRRFRNPCADRERGWS